MKRPTLEELRRELEAQKRALQAMVASAADIGDVVLAIAPEVDEQVSALVADLERSRDTRPRPHTLAFGIRV